MDRMHYHHIRIVVCNLYPFQDAVSKENANLADAIENIDIGRFLSIVLFSIQLIQFIRKSFF